MSRRVTYETKVNLEDEIVVKDITETEELSNSTIGIVSNCKKLRVRNYPGLEANVICEIEAGSKVEIDENESTEEFYKVCTETGIDGYCMKRFIKVES